MKAAVAAFNQEKALVGAFSVLTNLRMDLFEALMPSLKSVSLLQGTVRHELLPVWRAQAPPLLHRQPGALRGGELWPAAAYIPAVQDGLIIT